MTDHQVSTFIRRYKEIGDLRMALGVLGMDAVGWLRLQRTVAAGWGSQAERRAVHGALEVREGLQGRLERDAEGACSPIPWPFN